MGKIHKAAAAAALAVAIAGAAGAAVQDGAPVFKRNLFSDFVAINIQRATRINDIAQDGANRTWFATQGAGAGAARIAGASLAWAGSPFPINTGDSGYLLSNDLSSVVFADMGGQEHFLLGSSTDPVGVQAGRVTVGVDFVGNRLFTGANDTVNALATNGSGVVWVGAASGLHLVDISGTAPVGDDPSPADSNPVRRLADVSTAFGGPAVAYVRSGTNADELFIHTGAPPLIALPLYPTADRVEALFFQEFCSTGDPAAPCLWAVEDDVLTSRQRWLVRYDDLGTAPSIGMVATIDRSCFDDSNPLDNCNPTDLAINAVTGEFWLATRKGALFQIPDALGQLDPRVCTQGASWSDPADDTYAVEGDCAVKGAGWRPVMKESSSVEGVPNSTIQNYGSVFADPAGNVWLGSDYGLRALVVRYLTLDKTRYIGIDRRALVTLEDGEAEVTVPLDIPDVNDDPNALDLPVTVDVGGTSAKFYVLPDPDDGVYRLSFGFTTDAANNPVDDPLHRFPVTPSVEGENILVFYKFDDALGNERTLEARATWAEIVPFEDDLWIGGPCFLDLLQPRSPGATR